MMKAKFQSTKSAFFLSLESLKATETQSLLKFFLTFSTEASLSSLLPGISIFHILPPKPLSGEKRRRQPGCTCNGSCRVSKVVMRYSASLKSSSDEHISVFY